MCSRRSRRGCASKATLAERALALLPADGRPDLLLMASLLLHLTVMPAQDPEPVIFGLLDEMEFNAADRERDDAQRARRARLVAPMTRAGTPSQLRAALSVHTPEAIALAAALGGRELTERGRRARASGSSVCGWCACRSPATTCSPPASRPGRRSAPG